MILSRLYDSTFCRQCNLQKTQFILLHNSFYRINIRLNVFVFLICYTLSAGYPATDHHYGGGCPSLRVVFPDTRNNHPSLEVYLPKGGICMDVNLVISLISLVITCITFGMQIASMLHTKNDRQSSKD